MIWEDDKFYFLSLHYTGYISCYLQHVTLPTFSVYIPKLFLLQNLVYTELHDMGR